jgi:hypothetical protein
LGSVNLFLGLTWPMIPPDIFESGKKIDLDSLPCYEHDQGGEGGVPPPVIRALPGMREELCRNDCKDVQDCTDINGFINTTNVVGVVASASAPAPSPALASAADFLSLIAMTTNHTGAMLALCSQVALALALPPGTTPPSGPSSTTRSRSWTKYRRRWTRQRRWRGA